MNGRRRTSLREPKDGLRMAFTLLIGDSFRPDVLSRLIRTAEEMKGCLAPRKAPVKHRVCKLFHLTLSQVYEVGIAAIHINN